MAMLHTISACRRGVRRFANLLLWTACGGAAWTNSIAAGQDEVFEPPVVHTWTAFRPVGPETSPAPGRAAVVETARFDEQNKDLAVSPADEGVPPLPEPLSSADLDSLPELPVPFPDREAVPADRYPLDLATALQLAGANNLQVASAAERVREAAAQLERAELLWVPTLDFGIGYNRHDGQIQDTQGEVIDVSRQSLFLGAGAVGGGTAAPGAGGTPRLFVGLNPAEAYFAPLAARQSARAAAADRTTEFNDTLLEVGLAYYSLTEAELGGAIAAEAVRNLQELVRLTEQFEAAGAGVAADSARARAQLADAREALFRAEESTQVSSAELARLLRLDVTVTLTAAERLPLPVSFVPSDQALSALIEQAVAVRPEIDRERHRFAEADARFRQERIRPWVPNLYVGASGGGYGGGADDHFGDFDGRTDFDALAVWEFENLGLGNRARVREAASRQRQQSLEALRVRDLVAAQVAQAYHRVRIADERVEVAREQVVAAAKAVPLNFRGIRGGRLRPIEAQQAVTQLASAHGRYLTAVMDHNRNQIRLLYAVGNPVSPATAEAASPVPAAPVIPPPPPALP